MLLFSLAIFTSSFNGYASTIQISKDTLLFQQKIDSADFYLHSNIQKASAFYSEALNLVTAPKNERLKAAVYGRLGSLERMKSNYVKALEFHLKSLQIHEKHFDSLKIAKNFHDIGIVMRYQKQYDKSEKYLKKAIALRAQLNDTVGLGGSHSMLGVIYRRQKKYKEAENQYLIALSLFTLINDKEEIVHVKGNLASLYYFQKKYLKSNTINLNCLPYLKEIDKKSSLATRYANIARGYQRLKKYKIAVKYFDSVIAISKKQGYTRQLSNNYNGRSRMYYYLKDYKNALKDYRSYKKTNDSVFNIKKTREITTLLLNVEFEKQQVIDSLQFSVKEKNLQLIAESEKSKNRLYSLLLFVIILIGIVLFYVLKHKKNIVETKLKNKALLAKILEQKLGINKRESERVINEKAINLTYKKNLLSFISRLLKKGNTTTIFKDLNVLTIELNNQINKESSQSVLDEDFENLHVQFEKKLIQRHPTLTKTEREICSLILANKSIKDIVSIRGVTSASVQSIRYRIRKKLNVEKGQELHQFLKELS
ncbi:MAG: tetratricopeptide repeat protein [Flavobacteriales bacterium]|nr:tetratricopeptide repeat protein [Flavobacteriales bacterium]